MTKTAEVGIGGGSVPPGRAAKILDEAKRLAGRMGIEILLMDADLVFGRAHLESAVEHGFRAFERGTNVAASRMMEVMLYASGERQLSAAIEKMGVGDETERIAVLVSDGASLDAVMLALGIQPNDSVIEGDVRKLPAFGISKKAIESVGREKAKELVLEKVAAVDILK